jgi:hypothetical protein
MHDRQVAVRLRRFGQRRDQVAIEFDDGERSRGDRAAGR